MTATAAEGTARAATCQACIAALVNGNDDVIGALVSTGDGFAVASAVPDRIAADRLAAMASSLVSLSAAMASEGAAGDCRDLVIDGTAGRVLLMDVPQTGRQLVLTVLCGADATLGQVLWAARRCRQEMSERLAD